MQKKTEAGESPNKDAKRDSIVPFKETPSEGISGKPVSIEPAAKLNGTQLFSLFTADIIREDVQFTR
jgi:hypothetical protein